MVDMPRTARASVGGICYLVINRGNARAEVFYKERDYEAFIALIAAARGCHWRLARQCRPG